MDDRAEPQFCRDGSPNITCVERAAGMNHIRHVLVERLAVRGAPTSVLCMTAGLHDFGTVVPTQQRKELEYRLRHQYDQYFDQQREEWHAEPRHTPDEANREANTHHRYRLFTFSNFLTTPHTLWRFKANLEDILADAHAGSVLLTIGGKGGCYPEIQERMAELADAAGFRRLNHAVDVSAAAQLNHRLDDEIRWFYDHLKRLTGNLPVGGSGAARLRKEFEDDRSITFSSSTVHAFRKRS